MEQTPSVVALKHAHEGLRLLSFEAEAALEGGATWTMAWEVCLRLARQLRAHRREESAAVTACHRAQGRIGRVELDVLAMDHRAEQELLVLVTRSFRAAGSVDVEELRRLLLTCTTQLRAHMALQEQRLFPCLARAASVATGETLSPDADGPDLVTVASSFSTDKGLVTAERASRSGASSFQPKRRKAAGLPRADRAAAGESKPGSRNWWSLLKRLTRGDPEARLTAGVSGRRTRPGQAGMTEGVVEWLSVAAGSDADAQGSGQESDG